MQWWSDYFADVDTMQPEQYGAWFAEDIVLQFNNTPPIAGKAAVLAFLREFTRHFAAIAHAHGQLAGDMHNAAGEAVITFTTGDGAQCVVRGVTMISRDDTGFRRMAIFADFAAVYAALQGAVAA